MESIRSPRSEPVCTLSQMCCMVVKMPIENIADAKNLVIVWWLFCTSIQVFAIDANNKDKDKHLEPDSLVFGKESEKSKQPTKKTNHGACPCLCQISESELFQNNPSREYVGIGRHR